MGKVFCKIVGPILLAVFCFRSSSCVNRNVQLTKKYTIRLPLVVNYGGVINPLGDICSESLDLLLNRVNSQSTVLPDYNVIVDVIDDECSDAVAIRRVVPAFENWADIVDIAPNSRNNFQAKLRLPLDPIYTQNLTNQKAYTAPFLLGGVCSGSCKQTGKLPGHYDLIELVAGCMDPYMDENPLYPNFYRLGRSLGEYPDMRIELSKLMGWLKVAIFCDMGQYMFQDAQNFMQILTRRNVPILAVEFSSGDPTEALLRLKAKDARIIFAICYVNTCPIIACAAHRIRYFGPNVVWIFNSEIDLGSQAFRPSDCTPQMLIEVNEGSLYFGGDWTAASVAEDHRAEIGIHPAEITNYIRKQSPNSLVGGLAIEWRMFCFELPHNGIFIADLVERRLQLRNQTLFTFAADPGNARELRKMFVQANLDLQINATWGIRGYATHGETNKRFYMSPFIAVQQVQNGVKKVVFAQDKPDGALRPKLPFKWKTKTSRPPVAEAVPTDVAIHVSLSVIITVRFFTCLLILIIIASIVVLLLWRSKDLNSFAEMNALILLGTIAPPIAVLSYPSGDGDMSHFCLATPITIVVGCILSTGGLAVKIWTSYLFRIDGPISRFPKIRRQSFLLVTLWAAVLTSFLVAFYLGEGIPTAVKVTLSNNSEEPFPQELERSSWWTCSSNNFTIGWVLLGMQALFSVSSIIISVLAKGVLVKVFISDLDAVRNCLYISFTIQVIFICAIATLDNYDLHFGVLTTYAFSQALVIALFVALLKISKPEPKFVVTVRTHQKNNPRQSRKQLRFAIRGRESAAGHQSDGEK